MDHCPLRARALWHFFESAPDQLPGDGLFGALQLHETLGQKTHAPALSPLRRLRTSQSDQMRLLLSIELAWFGGLGPAVDQRRLQPLPSEPLAHPSDRRAADLQDIGDPGVGPGLLGSIFALVGFEKDARMGQPASRGVAASDQALQAAAILPGQAHGVVPLPGHREASSSSPPCGHPDQRARRHDTQEGALLQTNHVRTLGQRFESDLRLTTRGLEKRKTRDKGQLWRQCSPGRRSQRPWLVSCQILSSIAISSSTSSNEAAATFSSRCATEEVPGMGSIAAECPRSQASATCDRVASCRLATSSRGPPGLASLPVASGYQGMNPTPSRSQACSTASEERSERL